MNDPDYERAMGYALRLLSFRMRTQKELGERLARKGFDTAITAQILERLQDMGYLDDRAYVESYIRSRSKPTGRRLFRHELSKKGIDRDVAERGLQEHYSGKDELTAAAGLAAKLWRVAQRHNPELSGDTAARTLRLKTMQKIAAKLLLRGFSYETVKTVLSDIEPEFTESE